MSAVVSATKRDDRTARGSGDAASCARRPGPTVDTCAVPLRRTGSSGGLDAYDHLIPELRRLALSEPGDPGRAACRDRVIREFLPLVHNLARPFSASFSAEDLEQAGVLGLIKAIDRYDPELATHGPLAYVVPTVRGEIKRYLRDRTWSLRVPRGTKELAMSVRRMSTVLTQRLDRAPRPSEIAAELQVPVDDVVDTLTAMESYHALSLDVPDPHTGWPLAERIGDDDPQLDLVDYHDDLNRLIAELPERERTVLLLRFYGEQTQSQIAERVGVSQMQVSRLLSRALTRLRERLSADMAPAG